MPWSGHLKQASMRSACCFWDTLICARIMEEVEICAMGVACAPEVFNEVMDRLNAKRRGRPMSTLGQLQVVRAIGVAIVLEGSMHPTMELLLRHSIQYFGLKGSAMLRDPEHKFRGYCQGLANV